MYSGGWNGSASGMKRDLKRHHVSAMTPLAREISNQSTTTCFSVPDTPHTTSSSETSQETSFFTSNESLLARRGGKDGVESLEKTPYPAGIPGLGAKILLDDVEETSGSTETPTGRTKLTWEDLDAGRPGTKTIHDVEQMSKSPSSPITLSNSADGSSGFPKVCMAVHRGQTHSATRKRKSKFPGLSALLGKGLDELEATPSSLVTLEEIHTTATALDSRDPLPGPDTFFLSLPAHTRDELLKSFPRLQIEQNGKVLLDPIFSVKVILFFAPNLKYLISNIGDDEELAKTIDLRPFSTDSSSVNLVIDWMLECIHTPSVYNAAFFIHDAYFPLPLAINAYATFSLFGMHRETTSLFASIQKYLRIFKVPLEHIMVIWDMEGHSAESHWVKLIAKNIEAKRYCCQQVSRWDYQTHYWLLRSENRGLRNLVKPLDSWERAELTFEGREKLEGHMRWGDKSLSSRRTE